MALTIGRNIETDHDDGHEECRCRNWRGCIMAQSFVGLDNVQPYKLSYCSKYDYTRHRQRDLPTQYGVGKSNLLSFMSRAVQSELDEKWVKILGWLIEEETGS